MPPRTQPVGRSGVCKTATADMQEQKDSWDSYTWADPLDGWVSALSGRSALDTAFFAWERLTQQRKGRIPRRLQHGQLRHAVKLWLKCAREMRCVGLRADATLELELPEHMWGACVQTEVIDADRSEDVTNAKEGEDEVSEGSDFSTLYTWL